MDRHVRWVCGVVAAATMFGAGVSIAFAQESKSAPLVKEFVALAGGEMRYVSVKVPDAPDQFIGALHIPGVQILLVWARYEHPQFLNDMLAKRDYQGVYTDLQSASYTIVASRSFFEDLRADGFLPKRADDSSPFDMWESGGKRVMFTGDAKAQKLTDKEYADAFATADERYSRAMTLLIAELKKRGS